MVNILKKHDFMMVLVWFGFNQLDPIVMSRLSHLPARVMLEVCCNCMFLITSPPKMVATGAAGEGSGVNHIILYYYLF